MPSQVIDTPGVYDMPPEDYHADPCATPSLSAGSAIRMIQATPWHAWTDSSRLNPDFEPPEKKKEFDIGSAAHMMMTGKGAEIVVLDHKDFRSKAAQAERDDAYAAGMTPLLRVNYEETVRMVAQARRQLEAMGVGDVFEKARAAGTTEQAMFWRDHKTGTWCRLLADAMDYENRVCYDLKTCAGLAEPNSWLRKAMGEGIDMRVAHYLDGIRQCVGEGWTYRLVPLEKKAPHGLSVLDLDGPTLDLGADKMGLAKSRWARCLETGKWPGWFAGVVTVGARSYHETDWLTRRDEERDAERRTGRDILDLATRAQAPL